VEEAGIRFDRLTLGADASFRFEPSARSMVWFQVLEGDAKLKAFYTDGLSGRHRFRPNADSHSGGCASAAESEKPE
jgi:hypothetical protein